MISRWSEARTVPCFQESVRRTLAVGERAMVCELRLPRGDAVPSHRHPYEQVGYLVSGLLDFRIGDRRELVYPGDSWAIASDVEHDVVAVEESIAVDVFSPPRPDYL